MENLVYLQEDQNGLETDKSSQWQEIAVEISKRINKVSEIDCEQNNNNIIGVQNKLDCRNTQNEFKVIKLSNEIQEVDQEIMKLESQNQIMKKSNWSMEEDIKLFKYFKIHGTSWSKISRFLAEKSENATKNRFYSTLRRLFADYQKEPQKFLKVETLQTNCIQLAELSPSNINKHEDIQRGAIYCLLKEDILQQGFLEKDQTQSTEDNLIARYIQKVRLTKRPKKQDQDTQFELKSANQVIKKKKIEIDLELNHQKEQEIEDKVIDNSNSSTQVIGMCGIQPTINMSQDQTHQKSNLLLNQTLQQSLPIQGQLPVSIGPVQTPVQIIPSVPQFNIPFQYPVLQQQQQQQGGQEELLERYIREVLVYKITNLAGTNSVIQDSINALGGMLQKYHQNHSNIEQLYQQLNKSDIEGLDEKILQTLCFSFSVMDSGVSKLNTLIQRFQDSQAQLFINLPTQTCFNNLNNKIQKDNA